jgi:hypothetical protein
MSAIIDWEKNMIKRKKHPEFGMLFGEVESGFEPLYKVLQTSA